MNEPTERGTAPRVPRSLRVLGVVGGLLAVAIVGLLFLQPAAPRLVTIVVAPEGTSEHKLGTIYAEHLEAAGLEATLVEAHSIGESLDKVGEIEGAILGFFISGGEQELADPSVADGVVSLGSIGLEPLWIFARIDAEISSPMDLGKASIVTGPPRSKSGSIGGTILRELGLDGTVLNMDSVEESADALISGRADVGIAVGGVSSDLIVRLLAAEALQPVSLDLANAFVVKYSWLTAVTYPGGAFDMQRMIPAEDLRLVAGSTNLIVRWETHPALVDLLLDIASDVNGGAGPFWSRGTFPSADGVSLPLDLGASRFYDQGPSKWRRLLPYRLATIVDRLTGIILPALGTFLVVFQLIPGFFKFRLARRFKKLYHRLQEAEKHYADSAISTAEIEEELDGIDRDSIDLWVPRSQVAPYFELRQNMHDMRDRLDTRSGDTD